MTVGYAALDPVTKLASLDGRQVLISESQVTISVQRVRHEAPEAAARPWKEHYFGGDADASPAVLEELFQRADPRPDTLVVANLPLKWLGDDVSAYATRAANAEALREPMERLVGGPVAAVEAVVPDALTMRMVVYVRCRRLADVERGFARLYGKALRYVPSDMTAAAEVGVDRTSFFAPAACAARAQAEEQEMAARRQRQGQRERLGRERGELRAWLEEVKEKVGTEAEEERSQDLVRMMQEQLELMGELLDEAEGRDGEAKHPGTVVGWFGLIVVLAGWLRLLIGGRTHRSLMSLTKTLTSQATRAWRLCGR